MEEPVLPLVAIDIDSWKKLIQWLPAMQRSRPSEIVAGRGPWTTTETSVQPAKAASTFLPDPWPTHQGDRTLGWPSTSVGVLADDSRLMRSRSQPRLWRKIGSTCVRTIFPVFFLQGFWNTHPKPQTAPGPATHVCHTRLPHTSATHVCHTRATPLHIS